MSRFRERIEKAKRAFLAEVMDAAQEEALERVRAAFASVMPIRMPTASSPVEDDAAIGQPMAYVGARANDAPARAVAAACPQVAACVAAHPGISTRALATQLGMHSNKARHVLRVLMCQGIVRFQTVIEAHGGQVRLYFPVTPVPNNGAAVPTSAAAPGLAADLDFGPAPRLEAMRDAALAPDCSPAPVAAPVVELAQPIGVPREPLHRDHDIWRARDEQTA